MKNKKNIIYIVSREHEITYTGIKFSEFMDYLKTPIENILLLKANYIGNNFYKNFELVEGKEYIDDFKKEDIYNYGTFCFLDYSTYEKLNLLSDRDIADLLFMAHMFKPLNNPFYNSINNRFVYLAHDDGFFCKLYCRETNDFFDVLCKKITNSVKNTSKKNICYIDETEQKKILELASDGLLIDFEEIVVSKNDVSIKLFSVGRHINMDKILNGYQALKSNSNKTQLIKYKIQGDS